MYNFLLIGCFLPAMAFCLPLTSSERSILFEKIVIFGDSLSDNGNVLALTNYTYPFSPYWNGRFSNGPNWVDQLDIDGVSVTNYAHGSATSDSNLVQGYTKWGTIPVPGLLQQVEIYLNSTDDDNIDFTRTLYIIWGGNNDFLGDPRLSPCMIVESVFKTVQALLDVGAENILIFNQVPVQYFPVTQPFEVPELFTILTNEGNKYISLFRNATLFDNSQASIEIFDVHSLILDIITQNSTNLTNVADNCWEYANQTFVSQLCSNPNDYLFVDTLHFTNRAHGIVADALRSYLSNSYQTNTTTTSSKQSTSAGGSTWIRQSICASTSTSTSQFTSADDSTTSTQSISTSSSTSIILSTSTSTSTSTTQSTSTSNSTTSAQSISTSISTLIIPSSISAGDSTSIIQSTSTNGSTSSTQSTNTDEPTKEPGDSSTVFVPQIHILLMLLTFLRNF